MKQRNSPQLSKNDIANHTDNKIDQDFPGFPNGQSTENIITPQTPEENKIAAISIKDGEKVNKIKRDAGEWYSDGSGGAFNSTEEIIDDEDGNGRLGK